MKSQWKCRSDRFPGRRLKSFNRVLYHVGSWGAWLLGACFPVVPAQTVDSFSVQYTYDIKGRLLREVNGDGSAIRYLYDRADNLTESEVVVTMASSRTLTADYYNGSQGSYFTVQGSGFSAFSWVRLSINQVPVSPLIQCNASGAFEVVLFFERSDFGYYTVEAMAVPDPASGIRAPEAALAAWPSLTIFLTPGSAQRTRGSQSTLMTIPTGMAAAPVTAYLPLVLSSFQTPTPTNGLVFHLQADKGVSADGSGRVTQWGDQSGSGFHMIPIGTGSWTPPTLVASATANGLPAVRFASAAYTMMKTMSAVSLMQGAKDFTVFVVVKPGASQPTYADILDYTHASCQNIVLQQNGSATNQFGLPVKTLDSSRFQVLTQAFDFTSKLASSALDGTNRTATTTCATGYTYSEPVTLTVGGNLVWTSRRFNGDIAEIRIYNRLLTVTEMQSVEAALKSRYGL